ncbi:MAG TPA: thioredoxin domain-containing protein [Candidatus Polarisedimenticolia bacterium]|nr:thioredoxin domain-containing protein [Candidatus Polarisedimenticolia bacterium]
MKGSLPKFIPALSLTAVAAICACTAATGDASKEAGKAAAAPSGGMVAAKVGDKSITLQEIDERAAANLMKVRQQEYEVRQQMLDTLINEELLNKEAKAKGVSADELKKTEIYSKAPDATPAEVDSYYEQNKARLNGQTKEALAPQIAAMLKSTKTAGVEGDYYKALRAKYNVKVMLEPPRVTVAADDDPARGPASAPVTIVEFSDFQCPYCSRAETVVDEVMKKYEGKIRLVYRDYPLSFHPNAETAAMASECADEQGKYWEMHKAMFGNQSKLAAADLVETAGNVGMDKDKFKGCLDSGKFRTEVQKDFQDGQKAGVSGTPTFFINGVMIVGARDVNSFSEIIDRELNRSK